MVPISAADQSRSLRQSSKPMNPFHCPSANTGTHSVDLMPPSSNKGRIAGWKSRTCPAMVSPRSSRGIQSPSPTSARGHGRVFEFGRRRQPGLRPQKMLQDPAVAAETIDEKDTGAVDAGRAADLLGDLGQRKGEVGRAQQFLGRRHRFEQRVAAVPVECAERAGECFAADSAAASGRLDRIGAECLRHAGARTHKRKPFDLSHFPSVILPQGCRLSVWAIVKLVGNMVTARQTHA